MCFEVFQQRITWPWAFKAMFYITETPRFFLSKKTQLTYSAKDDL